MQTTLDASSLDVPTGVKLCVSRMADSLSMTPATAQQAAEVTNDPDGTIQEFAAIVERDTVLAADILSMANSAMYSPGQPVLTLNQAVLRLGFEQCKNLIFSASMSALIKQIPLEQTWIKESLCRHGFMTGLISLKINRALNIGCRGEEFTAGLMHDFGRLLLAASFPDLFPQFDSLTFDEDIGDFDRHERAAIGTTHCELGAWFVQELGLPGTLSDTIRFHHEPQRSRADRRLTALTSVSDRMANYLHRHGTAEGYDLENCLGTTVLEATGVTGARHRLAELSEALMENTAAEADGLLGF